MMLFAAGLLVTAAAVITGDAELSLVVVFPLVSGSGGLFLVGVALIMISFLVGFALLARGQAELARDGPGMPGPASGGRGGTKYGGVVLVGPVPIAFGSSMRLAIAMLVIGVILAAVVLGLLIVGAG